MKLRSSFIFLCSLSFVLFAYGIHPVYAGEITVTTTVDTDAADSDCSLREAIIAANTDTTYNGCTISGAPGDDTIDLTVISGTLTLGSDLPVISQTVQFNGPSTNTLTLDGVNTYNAIEGAGSGVDIGVDHLTITNVISDGIYTPNNITVTNSTIVGSDCGLFSQNGSAFVNNSDITGNDCDGVSVFDTTIITGSTITGAVDGIFAFSGNAQVSRSTIIAGGDGVSAFGDAIVSTTFISATVDGVYADSGNAQVMSSTIIAGDEGVEVSGDIMVNSSTITAADNGVLAFDGNVEVISSTVTSLTDDGVDANTGYARVTNSTIFANESGIDTDTGDIEVTNSRVIGDEDGLNAVGNATVISSTITGKSLTGVQTGANATVSYSAVINSGDDGVNALTANIFQSTISGNGGDGVESSNQTTVTISYSTIVNNTGYGINNTGGTTVVSHTIVAKNDGLGTTRDVNATLSAGSSYNLIGNGDGAGVTNGVDGNLVGSTGALLDPKLDTLADNGGTTQTHALLFTSPALDAIPAAGCTVTTDQRGEPRPFGSNCDIGAYEAQNVPGEFLYFPIMFKE